MIADAGKGYVWPQVGLNNGLFNKVEIVKIEVRRGVRGLRVGHDSRKISTQCVMSASGKKKIKLYLQSSPEEQSALLDRESDVFIKAESFNQIKMPSVHSGLHFLVEFISAKYIPLLEKQSCPENSA